MKKVTQRALKQRYPVSISRRLRQLREDRDLTQRELAKFCGCGPSTLALYETGRSQPRFDLLQRLAVAFEMTLEELVDGRQVEKPQPPDAISTSTPAAPVIY